MKIAIVGLGKVGATIAYTIVLKGLANTLVLANRDEAKAAGEALDLVHSLAFCEHSMQIMGGAIDAANGCDILVISASVPTNSTMLSRLELAIPNIELFRQLIPQLAQSNPNALLVIVSNPVDVLTYLATELSGFAANRVMGVSTLVDSARFRVALSESEKIHPSDLRAYVLGEHGPNQFPVFSQAVVGSETILDNPNHRALFDEVRQAGFKICQLKGFTNYAIASATCEVLKAIVFDEHHTMPLSTCFSEWLGIKNNCFSIPVVVGREGIIRHLHPTLNAREQEDLMSAATIIAQNNKQYLS